MTSEVFQHSAHMRSRLTWMQLIIKTRITEKAAKVQALVLTSTRLKCQSMGRTLVLMQLSRVLCVSYQNRH